MLKKHILATYKEFMKFASVVLNILFFFTFRLLKSSSLKPYMLKRLLETYTQELRNFFVRFKITFSSQFIFLCDRGAKYHTSQEYSNKTFTNYTVTNLDCTGYEEYITECASDPWMEGSCKGGVALEVECSTYRFLTPFYHVVLILFQTVNKWCMKFVLTVNCHCYLNLDKYYTD